MEEQIIDVLQKKPKITQTQLAKLFNVSYRFLQRRMDELKLAGRIERIGGKRYGHWQINEWEKVNNKTDLVNADPGKVENLGIFVD